MEQVSSDSLKNNLNRSASIWKRRFGYDVFWAGIIGIVLGLSCSVVVWYVQDGIKSYFYAKSASVFLAPTPKVLKLSITQPEDGLTSETSNIKIIGTTTTPAKIILTGGANDVITLSNGTFSADYELAEGENDLSVVAFSDYGETDQAEVSVLYVKDLE